MCVRCCDCCLICGRVVGSGLSWVICVRYVVDLLNCPPVRTTDIDADLDHGEAGWWTTSGNIGLPPLARVMGVGRQQQQLGSRAQHTQSLEDHT